MATVHKWLKLYIADDKFYLESAEPSSKVNEILVIDRVSQELRLENTLQAPPNAECKLIHGLFGIIRLIAGPYLIVITRKVNIGEIHGQCIYKIVDTEIIPYKKTTLHLNEQQIADNAKYLSMIEHMLSVDGYYYCPTYDITHTMQRLDNTSPDFIHMPYHDRADVRFVWNNHLLRELSQQSELCHFCLPIMHGFITVVSSKVKGKSFKYILISRRSCFRAGTRYYVRGLDSEGHAANFVETEQIVEYDGYRSSFVQTRGSVPLFWYQYPNLKYKPDPVIVSSQNQVDGFQRHFAAQIYNYGRQVLINLLDKKGLEKNLVQAFGNAVENSQNNNIRYEHFDFHKECRKLQWHRLSLLVDKLANDQAKFGYFMLEGETVICSQEGVFRTNCIDCLDRTNVVQSLLARKSLQDQFIKMCLLLPGERVEDQNSFEETFKNVWADNADACAKQYAGTGALKTDYTRTGQRTFRGMLKDGWNSAIRYFMNNFYDGFRQDAIDLFLGNYVVEENEGVTKPSPLRPERDWKVYALPAIFMVAFSMCVISVLIPDENPSEQLMYVLFWGGASLITLGIIYFFGIEFVDKPRLALAKVKLE
ncbi:hypothetical protein LSH36_35g08022 [Paralvinella palmiformis]|uniref:Phosphatidylinositol-3-phosphatase SAC1 n=1 Tax=Paralvinella palmiformis TaxID=53620 RepID=A0AAD9NH00_9ANNE|nr:hypothetical protein LSH36_35g08022 [Paralvinella palmiformis]